MAISMLDVFLDFQNKTQTATLHAWNQFSRAHGSPGSANDVRTAATPHDIVYEEGSLKLLHYRNADPRKCQEPLLVCFSLVNRPYILDLQEKRSVVRQLLKQGLDVYLIDWGIPTAADRTLSLHDYVCKFTKHAADFVCAHAESAQLSLMGYCMGGTMSTMFTSLYQEQVKNLILMAAPIDFSGDESLLNLWVRQEYFDVDGLIDAYGNCPGFFLQSCFQLMKPVTNFVEKYTRLFENYDNNAFLDNFFALEQWANDNIPVAGETFREFVKALYQQNRLVKHQMRLHEVPIDLKKITCPLLMLVADYDHLVPPSSTVAIKEHIRSKETEKMSINAGHIGLAFSSKAHQQLWPKAARWIADHSTAR